MIIGSGDEGSETVDVTSNEGESFVGDDLPVVGTGTRSDSGVDMVLLLKVMEDRGR